MAHAGGSGLQKPRILLVEDEPILGSMWSEQLEGKGFEVVWAPDLNTAEKEFERNSNFVLIVMNCCVPGNKPNSMWLVEKIRNQGFCNPIIATSGAPAFCEKLITAGASHAAEGMELVDLIDNLTVRN